MFGCLGWGDGHWHHVVSGGRRAGKRCCSLYTRARFSCLRKAFLFGVLKMAISKYEVVFLCGFVCISLMINHGKHLSCTQLAICVSSERYLCRSFADTLIGLPLCCWVVQKFFPYCGHGTVTRYVICRYFLPFCSLSFHFLDQVLWCRGKKF